MSSTSRAATARLRSVGAVESIAYSPTGGEVPLGVSGRRDHRGLTSNVTEPLGVCL